MTDLDDIRARHAHAGILANCDTAIVLAALDAVQADLDHDLTARRNADVAAGLQAALDAAIEREARLRAALEGHHSYPATDKFENCQVCRAALATTPEGE